jgi:hypothetical protein
MDNTKEAALTLYTLQRGLREALVDAGINEDTMSKALMQAMQTGRAADKIRAFEVLAKLLGQKAADNLNINHSGLDEVMEELEKKIESRKSRA